jgi:hypothetical protein
MPFEGEERTAEQIILEAMLDRPTTSCSRTFG